MLGQRVRYFRDRDTSIRDIEHMIGDYDIMQRFAINLGTHQIKDKHDVTRYIESNEFEIAVSLKNVAIHLNKIANMCFLTTEIPYGQLLIPVSAAFNTAEYRILTQKYWTGNHIMSDMMVKLYDGLTYNVFQDFDKIKRICYSGQFGWQPAVPIFPEIGNIYQMQKWQQDPAFFGLAEDDHAEYNIANEISWKGANEELTRGVNNEMIRWNLDYSETLTKIPTLGWTRLHLQNLIAPFVMGYENNVFLVTNKISRENQSYSSRRLFNVQCGWNYYSIPSITGLSWMPYAYGTYKLNKYRLINKEYKIGTVNAIIPWSNSTHAYMYLLLTSQQIHTYDFTAPNLANVPIEEESPNLSFFR
jgi:hypothetical protein